MITSFELIKRSERFYPFAIIAIYYGIAAFLFAERITIGSPFDIILISTTALIVLLLIISFRFKVSVHASAVWSSVGILSGLIVVSGIDLGMYFYLAILAAGCTSASRLYLGYHSPKEVWAGSLLGFFYSFFVIFSLV